MFFIFLKFFKITIILVANDTFTKFSLEKDIAVELVKLVSASPNFKIG